MYLDSISSPLTPTQTSGKHDQVLSIRRNSADDEYSLAPLDDLYPPQDDGVYSGMSSLAWSNLDNITDLSSLASLIRPQFIDSGFANSATLPPCQYR